MERIKKPFASRCMLAIRLHCYEYCISRKKLRTKKNPNICHRCSKSVCVVKPGIQNHINKQTGIDYYYCYYHWTKKIITVMLANHKKRIEMKREKK